MKIYLFLASLLLMVSCNKQSFDCPEINRKVQFSLYTDKDFSNYADRVTFTLSIRNAHSRIIWDSVLPPMRIMDIPSKENKLVFAKDLAGYEDIKLRVGFVYNIENVGISWFWDKIEPCEENKEIEFNFR